MANIRQEAGLTRPEMARALKVTPSALWKIEMGKTVPKPKTIERFCEFLHLPLARLYVESLEASDFVIED